MISQLAMRRARSAFFIVAAFILPFYFAIRGTDWTVGMHPDELAIRSSMETFSEHLHPNVEGSVYPEGFFVLSNIYRKVAAFWTQVGNIALQEPSGSRDIDKVREPAGRPWRPSIATGRRTNAVLAGLSGVFLYFCVLVATGSAAGGLCAAILGACSPFVVEHAHYCESDLSFVFGMTLALAMLSGAVRHKTGGWMIAASAACAAAFACKYTVFPLIPVCVLVFLWLSPKWGWGRACAIALGCFAAGFAAYVCFTPLFYIDPELYWEKIFNIYRNAHKETVDRDLTCASASAFLRQRYIARLLLVQLRAFGTGGLVLAAAGAGVLALYAKRVAQGMWVVVLLAAFLAFDLACAPWVRSQEFLPFAILLGTIPALAFGTVCSAARERGFSALSCAMAALCLALSAFIMLPQSSRVATQFSSIDTRNVARRWLEMSSNPDTRFAAGRFASPALRGGKITTAEVFGDAEKRWSPGSIDPNNPGHEYFVRQTLLPGRGFINNTTGELHPKYQAGLSNFLSHATLLREWKNSPGYQPTFCQLPIELWSIEQPGDPVALPNAHAPRATAYYMGAEAYDAAQGGDWLGPVEAIRTVGRRKSVRFIAPADRSAVYAVTRHLKGQGDAKIKWEDLFEPAEKIIAPGKADYFICDCGKTAAWRSLGDIYLRTRVRMRGNDQTSLCLTTITHDPVYAAALLERGGSPEKAAELLGSAGLPTTLDEAIATTAPRLQRHVWQDFARIRFDKFTIYPAIDESTLALNDSAALGGDAEAEDLDALKMEQDLDPERHLGSTRSSKPANDPDPQNTPLVTCPLDTEFPVTFDPGKYEISFTLPQSCDEPKLLSVTVGDTAKQRIVSAENGRMVLEVEFDKPTAPRLYGESVAPKGMPHAATLRDFQIRWDP